MIVPTIRTSQLGGSPELPIMVMGPSLGTSVATLWAPAAQRLAGTYHAIGWDLPGHDISPPPRAAFRIEDLAAGVIEAEDQRIGARLHSRLS